MGSIFAAATESGRLGSYRTNGNTGELTPLETYSGGKRPTWVLALEVSLCPDTGSQIASTEKFV